MPWGNRVGKASGYKKREVLGVLPAEQPLRGPPGLFKGVLLTEHAGTASPSEAVRASVSWM